MESLADEVERVRGIVGRFFPIYDVRVRPEAIAFYVRVDPASLNEKFEALRTELRDGRYIPFLRYQGGEHVLYIQRSPQKKFRGPILNVILLIATLASTVYAGMILWNGTYGRGEDILALPTVLNGTLFFALPLLAILGVHEMGHFLLARRHDVAASLPFFIPAPFTFIGTFGALISMREPIPNKKALLDIGISGPLAGLALAFPITLLGLWMNALDPVFGGPNTGGGFIVNMPLIYEFLLFFIPIPDEALLHPTAFAGWVGFLVTALNLLPAGQLDGGHVARALLGDNAKYLSYAAFFTLIGISLWTGFLSWLILAVFVLVIGLRHPPPLNDLSRLRPGRKAVGFVVLVILVLSFHPVPLQQIPVEADIELHDFVDPARVVSEVNVALNESGQGVYLFTVNNTGNVRLQVALAFGPAVDNLPQWEIFFAAVGGEEVRARNHTTFLDAGEAAFVSVLITAPEDVQPFPVTVDVQVTATAGGTRVVETLTLRVQPT